MDGVEFYMKEMLAALLIFTILFMDILAIVIVLYWLWCLYNRILDWLGW